MAALLQVLQERNLIAESGSSASPLVLEEKKEAAVEEKVVGVSQGETKEEENESEKKKKKMRRALRVGAEGDEVRAMQVCLQPLINKCCSKGEFLQLVISSLFFHLIVWQC